MQETVVIYGEKNGEHRRLATTTKAISPAERELIGIVKRFFTSDEEGGAWLLFRLASHESLAVLAGSFRPRRKSTKQLRRLGLGLGFIDLAFAELVGSYGVAGVEWNGKAVVASRTAKAKMQ